VRALHRKLVRDLIAARGQVVSTALVVAAGIAAYLALMGTYQALRASQETYYERRGFPHLFASVRRAPESVADRVRAIEDVAQVQTRLAFAARFDLVGLPEPAAGRVVSLPADDEPGLPELHLLRGRLPVADRPGEAVVLESFATAHGVAIGDDLPAIAEGRQLALRVVGVALSPEYVVPVAASGLYQPGRFCVAWLRREQLERDLGMDGQLTELTLRLRPGADEAEVIAAVDRVLAPWGTPGAHGRADQASHRALDGELSQLEGLALRVPLIFLAVEAFLLAIVLGRLVGVQREQIAALKAVGYGRGAIGRHYLGFAGVILGLGAVLGVVLGTWGGAAFTRMYLTFFHVPTVEPAVTVPSVAAAVGVSALAALVGAGRAVRRAVRLPPAEAMRPPVPARYRVGVLSRLGVPRLLTHTGRMVVRELERRPGRALASSAGIAMAIALLVVGRFQYDALDWFLGNDLGRGMPADAVVGFARAVDASAVAELRRIPGVLDAEAVCDVPVRMRAGHRDRSAVLRGTGAPARLRRLVQLDGSFAEVPADGIAFGSALAEALGVGVGDRVHIERLDGDHRHVEVRVAALVDDLAGRFAYGRDRTIERLFDQGPTATSAFVRLDAGRVDEVQRRLRESPLVLAVTTRREMIDVFLATTGSYSGVFTLLVVVFATILAVGIVYGNARVALSERARDLATLRVLGFRRDEVAGVLLGELAVHVAVAIPLGMAGGYLLARAVMSTMDPELYRLPLVIYPRTYAFAVMTVLGAALACAYLVRRRLDRIDFIAALKARD
jgi:putative ABC transport system permease protein